MEKTQMLWRLWYRSISSCWTKSSPPTNILPSNWFSYFNNQWLAQSGRLWHVCKTWINFIWLQQITTTYSSELKEVEEFYKDDFNSSELETHLRLLLKWILMMMGFHHISRHLQTYEVFAYIPATITMYKVLLQSTKLRPTSGQPWDNPDQTTHIITHT